MGFSFLAMFTPLVVIDDFHVFWTCLFPYEANPILVVNANTVLPNPVTYKRFKSVSRRNLQETQSRGCIQLNQLSSRHGFKSHEPRDSVSVEQRLGVFALEGLDSHDGMAISLIDTAQARPTA